ncbi:hypothetical protein HCJ39_13200 [Listeria rocourtiae]|uniref:hypothetical protein n=1 Tax=Listeria rocourtiae TaxID=647910 RepID=UPI001623465B|nr:hypothetical protein [Listeria rocourtiae]MBC1605671.1 hypothetical protein [Listeria rocourtiae]
MRKQMILHMILNYVQIALYVLVSFAPAISFAHGLMTFEQAILVYLALAILFFSSGRK